MNVLIDEIEFIKSFDNVVKIINDSQFSPIKWVKPINKADKHSLVFIDKNAKSKLNLLNNTSAKVIICDFIPENEDVFKEKCLLIHENPKLFFAQLVNCVLTKEYKFEIHSTAIVHPEAIIHQKCQIGPNTIIGKCKIGEGTIIHGNCSIYDNVTIGKHVIIDSGAVIGAAGFGFVRDNEGIPHQFPQLGGVLIEDDVEIGANTCIDRGALEDTIIRKGVKIDNLVQIAHNVEIGKYTYIISQTVIAGSTKIGEKCWIAPSYIMNKITIGDNVTIGFGSVVLKSANSCETYMGNPALSIEKYSRLQYKLKKL